MPPETRAQNRTGMFGVGHAATADPSDVQDAASSTTPKKFINPCCVTVVKLERARPFSRTYKMGRSESRGGQDGLAPDLRR